MDIKQRILARADLADLRAARDLDGLAAALNAEGATSVQSRFVTMRTIVAECDNADTIVAALVATAPAVPTVGEMLNFLRSDSGMDVGHPKTQGRIDALAQAGALTAEQAQQLKVLALQPVVVTRDQVKDAMFNDDGTEK